MKPEQFIREFGVDKAREVLEIVPENEHYFTNVMIKPCGNWVYSQIARLTHHDGVKFNVSFKLLEEWKPKFVNLKDLKRLVESVEIVELFDSIEGAKDAYKNGLGFHSILIGGYEIPIARLGDAIKDHESIYGGGDD
ncbi:hypothetical protein [Acinetobacter baumannii]|uniref:hypothetical protein n=1 Tax=Acinetobacter baumannii TaxID=470 RepID=UPI000DE6D5FF|nr:hypothetical protein [Acinetobacter baumannii]SSO90986.1 Uncharacterised protein [Acinetobacter baumannii]